MKREADRPDDSEPSPGPPPMMSIETHHAQGPTAYSASIAHRGLIPNPSGSLCPARRRCQPA